MGSKLQMKRSGELLRKVLRSQRDCRRASFNVDRMPTLAGLSLAGLFVDRAGLDAFVVGECIVSEAEEVRHAVA